VGRIDSAAYAAAKQSAVHGTGFPQVIELPEFLQRTGLFEAPPSTLAPSPVPPRPPGSALVLDVRSPCEFAKGHIPGAVNLSLFSDDERAQVGTLYKQQGHDAAVQHGVKLVDQSWETMLARLPATVCEGDQLLVYCKRGGMRSAGVSWLLSQGPFDVHQLAGGYRSFRGWANSSAWAADRRLVVLAGRTGSGKTDVLQALRASCNAQMIDLEGEAHHRGSSFGALGKPPQPTNEMFENTLALQWASFNARQPVFIEDEGRHVGSVGVPSGLWARMRADDTTVIRLEVPHAARVNRLVGEYGVHPPEMLADCVTRLKKRLGHEKTCKAVGLLEQEPPALDQVAEIMLEHYYDAMYLHQAEGRPGRVNLLECDTTDAEQAAVLALNYLDSLDR